jgi:hypothetical protein
LDSAPGGAGGWGAGARVGRAGADDRLPKRLHSIGRDHGSCLDHLSVYLSVHFLLFGKIPCNHWCCVSLSIRHILLSHRRDQLRIVVVVIADHQSAVSPARYGVATGAELTSVVRLTPRSAAGADRGSRNVMENSQHRIRRMSLRGWGRERWSADSTTLR